ncbi:DUF222 domain-containing protein, partial [Microbacterium sp.]|uniref:DUF222 domain-containing protein n=1 Tax=Microbacterium sp. TaxID=51671 RepID=UPI0035AF6020
MAVILETGGAMTDAAARADFERAAVALAERETPGRLRPLLRSLAARLDPRSVDQRHFEAKEGRGVWVQDIDDGMAQLIATLPAAIAHAIRDRLTRFAHSVIDAREAAVEPDSATRADGDARTVEQLRADVLADLLLTADPTAVPRSADPIVATVQVVVPALTLLRGTGVSDGDPVDSGSAEHGSAAPLVAGPAELVGRAPIDIATARCLAGTAAGWDRILTNPVSGAVLAVDRYRPSEEQRRLLRARDERCR